VCWCSAVEGLVNAVEHGSAAGGRVSVRCEVHTERAELLIVDGGRSGGRTPRLHPGIAGPDATSGRGLALVHGLADAVTCPLPTRHRAPARIRTPAGGSDPMSPLTLLAPAELDGVPHRLGTAPKFEDRNGEGLVSDTCRVAWGSARS